MNLPDFEKLVIKFMIISLRYMQSNLIKGRYSNADSSFEFRKYMETLEEDIDAFRKEIKKL